MEIAEFMFRFQNKMLPIFLTITSLLLVKSTNTILDKKLKVNIIIIHMIANLGENDFNHECLKLWEWVSLTEKRVLLQ